MNGPPLMDNPQSNRLNPNTFTTIKSKPNPLFHSPITPKANPNLTTKQSIKISIKKSFPNIKETQLVTNLAKTPPILCRPLSFHQINNPALYLSYLLIFRRTINKLIQNLIKNRVLHHSKFFQIYKSISAHQKLSQAKFTPLIQAKLATFKAKNNLHKFFSKEMAISLMNPINSHRIPTIIILIPKLRNKLRKTNNIIHNSSRSNMTMILI